MRTWFKPAVLFLAVALAACDSDSTGPGAQASIVGTWDVQSIDGNTLPYSETETFEGVTCTFTINSMHVTFTNNGTFNGSEVFSAVCPGLPEFPDETLQFNGTYSISGNQITLNSADGETETGTWSISGSTLTMVNTSEGVTTTIVARRR